MHNLSFRKILTNQDGSSVTHSFFSEEGELIYEIIYHTTNGRTSFKMVKNGDSYINIKNVKIDQPPIDQLKIALEQVNECQECKHVNELQEIIEGINRELFQ